MERKERINKAREILAKSAGFLLDPEGLEYWEQKNGRLLQAIAMSAQAIGILLLVEIDSEDASG